MCNLVLNIDILHHRYAHFWGHVTRFHVNYCAAVICFGQTYAFVC